MTLDGNCATNLFIRSCASFWNRSRNRPQGINRCTTEAVFAVICISARTNRGGEGVGRDGGREGGADKEGRERVIPLCNNEEIHECHVAIAPLRKFDCRHSRRAVIFVVGNPIVREKRNDVRTTCFVPRVCTRVVRSTSRLWPKTGRGTKYVLYQG